jgi:AhpD family alkylhydroperoxidase
MSEDVLYKKSYFQRIGEFKKLAPEAFRSYVAFDQLAVAPGELSGKLKELMAVAVAHTTGCPYCIEVHVAGVKHYHVTKEEMAESIMVATALKAGSAIAHGVNALNAYDEIDSDSLYKESYFDRLPEFMNLAKDSFAAFLAFDQAAMQPGVLTKKEKELIAVAVAHTTGCPYCIALHTKGAKQSGANAKEVAEAIFVATALKAGSAIARGVNALNAFDD